MSLKCSDKHAMEVDIFVGCGVGSMHSCTQASLRLTDRFSGQPIQETKTTIKLPGFFFCLFVLLIYIIEQNVTVLCFVPH